MGRRRARPRKTKEKADGSSTPKVVPGVASMEKTMAELTRLFQGRAGGKSNKGEDVSWQAQELMYDAWERSRKQDRIRLAEEALQLWPDCADAYNLLAEEKSRSVTEVRSYLEKAVEAGERALGQETFEEHVGHFWGIVETRPYMRARAGLAECLWKLGEEQAALVHYEDMLRLNPNDNQGVRGVLLTRLLKLGDQDRAGELLEAYADDGSAIWLYNRALWLFRQHGESSEANQALEEAIAQNGYVPAYLLRKKKVPRQLPNYMGWGDESEAQVYAADAAEVWRDTDGSTAWLARFVQASTASAS